MDLRDSISIDDLSAVAEEGLTTNIDNECSFSTNRPLAMSTVAREVRNQKYKSKVDDVTSGSFINNSISTPPGNRNQSMHQLRLSFSALDQSDPLSKPRVVRGSKSEQLLPKQDDSLQFENSWGPPPYGIRSDFDDSRKSSLGLIPVDAMSDLTSSMFNLDMPALQQNKQGNRSVQGSSSHTSNDSRTNSQIKGTSLGNSNGQVSGSDSHSSSLGHSQRLGSTNDSLKTAFFRHDVETVKKKPSDKPASVPEGPVRQSLIFKEMFTGHQDGDVTLPEVNIDNEELQEFDDDFSDFDETGITDIEEEKRDLPPDDDALDSIYLKVMSHNGGDGAENTQITQLFPSLSKVTLFDDVGSNDDLRNIEGKQTTQSSEIDTEDELEMARQSMGLEREIGAGQCSDNRASIPRPGVEGTSQQESSRTQFSIAMRQSAEGDAVTSPIPGDGGGGGDGSSGSESDDRTTRRSTDAKNFIDTFRPNFRPVMPPPSGSVDIEEQRVKPMGDDLLTEKGIDRYSTYQEHNMENESLLQSRYLAPTPMFNSSDTTSQLQWSVDNTDDFSQNKVTTSQSIQDPGNRLEASGFNAEDIISNEQEDNPFGDVRNSFGSFASSPPRRQSHDITPTGDITFEPLASPRTSIDSKSQYTVSPPRFSEEPIFSKASPQPSQTQRHSHKSIQEVKHTGVDLAFVSSLKTEAAEQKALASEMVAQGNLGVDFTINEDFMGSDQARNLLDQDEQEFEKENIFREDDNMESDVFPSSDSWLLKSKMTVPDDEICRISVGQFMKSRSGALGSLDGDGPRPDFGMVIKTPPSSRKPYPLLEETNTDSYLRASIDNSESTLHMSDISKFMASVTMSKDPQEIAKMVIDWSNKASKKGKDSQTKSSKLPVKKGSSLQYRDKQLTYEDMTLSELSPTPSVQENTTKKQVIEQSADKSSSKLKEEKSHTFTFENKTNPDGEESEKDDRNVGHGDVTPPRTSGDDTIVDGYSPRLSVARLMKSSTDLFPCDGMNESLDQFLSQQKRKDDRNSKLDSSRQAMQPERVTSSSQCISTSSHIVESMSRPGGGMMDRSPRGSMSGWAGHHIPDGTEYSKSSDCHTGLNRQELVGTEDIQLADSRGFDAISDKKHSQELKYLESQPIMGRHSDDFDPKKHHAMLKLQANKHKHSYSAENLTSTPLKNGVHLDYKDAVVRSFANTLPTHQSLNPGRTQSLPEQKSGDHQFSQTMPEKFYAELKKTENSNTVQNVTSSNYSRHNIPQTTQNSKTSIPENSIVSSDQHKKIDDKLLMPPPPVPSFQHNLLPRQRTQQGSQPTLLTSDSMMSKDFAKMYLAREDPSRLVNRNVHPVPVERPLETNTMKCSRDSDIPLPTHHDWPGDDMNITDRLPCYHSTPYSGNRVDTTITTPSSMHTMMSTGMMTELQAENLTIMEDECNQIREAPKLSVVTSPSIVQFPEVCCVGISTETSLCLTNPTKNWIECLLQVQEWTIDGREIALMDYSPFEMKKKVIIEPQTCENVTVIFIPKIAGVYVAQLNVTSGLFLQDNSVRIVMIPTIVTLQAIAEKPQVQVRTDGYNRCMNFGHIAWGSCHEMSLQIINRGQASIPMRLSISLSEGSWHSFSFDTKLADVSVISRSVRPRSAAIGRTVMPVCIRGRTADSEPTIYDVKIYCRPPEKQYSRAMAQYPPAEMCARIDVEVDTPFHLPLISSIDLKAVVGIPKLHLSRQLEMLTFKTSTNQRVSQTFNLKNAGNIDMKLLLGVIEFQELFSVDPSQFTIPPGQEASVTVSFIPTAVLNVEAIETVLLMSILPQGPDYDLPIRAEIKREPLRVTGTQRPVLLGDRQFLDFGGVPVGQSLVKRYTLKNQTSSQLKLFMEIRSDTDSFQMLCNDRRSYTRELIISGGEKFVVNMEYRPSAVRQHAGKLVVKPSGMTVKYSIPLEGYGGTSMLVIQGASVIEGTSREQKYFLNFTGIEPNKCQIQKIVLKNVGPRAAYVKAISFTDPKCKHVIRAPKVLIEPSEFILKEKSSKSVTVVFNPSERECALCSEGREIVGAVAFLFGDEVSRQRMRRVIHTHQDQGWKRVPRSLCDENVLYSINFNTVYIDEDCIPDLPAAITDVGPSKDIDLFYKNMSKLTLTLVASAVPSHRSVVNLASTLQNGNMTSTLQNGTLASTMPSGINYSAMPNGNTGSSDYHSPSLSRSSAQPQRNLQSTMPIRNTSTTPPNHHRSSSYPHGNQISEEPVKQTNRESVPSTMAGPVIGHLFTRCLMADTDDKADWMIKPDQLILHAPTNRYDRPEVSKFQIINFLNRELSFKMAWLNQWLKITPEEVKVLPKSTTSICISPSATVLQNMETLPWSGTVHISCDDQYKVLNVQIRKDANVETNGAKSLVPLFKQASATPAICIPPETDQQAGPLQTNTSQVNFSPTKVGEMSETYIDLTNVSSEMLRWTISSFAPPYVKGADNSKDVFRATYKVFVFSEKFGHLEARQSTQLCMQFMPRSKGTFSQFWDIQSRGSSTNSVRIELKGEGIEEVKKTKEEELKKRKEETFTLENAEVTQEFSPCDIGHVQMIKVQMKNRSCAPQTVEVIPPQPPFFVKYSSFSVKPKSYIRFPIEFRPSGYGEFDGLVIFKPNIDNSLSCKIHGVCKRL